MSSPRAPGLPCDRTGRKVADDGWVGGTGTAAHLTPSTGAVTILLSQLAATSPEQPPMIRDFWTYAASA